jgi:hypothetical protein
VAWLPVSCYAAAALVSVSGWNHSTQLTRQEQRQWQRQLDGKAAAATMKRTGELKT